MNILSLILKKRGIESETDLSAEEKAEFEQWKKVLGKKEIDIKDLAAFCEAQIRLIKAQLDDLERTPEKTDRLVLLLGVYEKILGLIQSPEKEKEQLVTYLQGLL